MTSKTWLDYLVATYPPFGSFVARKQIQCDLYRSGFTDELGITTKEPIILIGYLSKYTSEDGTLTVGTTLGMTQSQDGSWHVYSFRNSYGKPK